MRESFKSKQKLSFAQGIPHQGEWDGLEWNRMKYVIQVKGPALGPVRSFSADRRRKEKRKDRMRRKYTPQN